jgi:hypothetical protein
MNIYIQIYIYIHTYIHTYIHEYTCIRSRRARTLTKNIQITFKYLFMLKLEDIVISKNEIISNYEKMKKSTFFYEIHVLPN